MRRGIVAVIGIVALIIVLLVLQLTSPREVGLFGILLFFILVYVFFACMLYVLLASIVVILKLAMKQGRWKVAIEGVTRMKIYYYASMLALTPVILIGMHSVGAVEPADVGLLIAFEILGCFYISKRF